jgi:hypothetical protein
VPKESIPGTSSFSARPDDANGAGSIRKRKATVSTPATTNAAKKIFTAAPGDSDSGYFTNMLSFEASEPILKDGHITADDGTTLGINGMFQISDFSLLPISPPILNGSFPHPRVKQD